ncbi:MAG: energy-coupling factor ABC transporter ATP-binding protein [Candidatus Bathyarchaeia archaeon]
MIEIRNLTFRYPSGLEALRNISLRIGKTDFVVIMGENGAGKTTLLKHINGLLRPTKGDVFIDGINTRGTNVADLARRVGLVFQNPDHQFFRESVDAEIRFALENFGFDAEQIEKRVDWAVKFFGLRDYLDRSPFLLSGGEKKRVAMASVLAWDPDYILFDEPTLGQDHRQKKRLLRLLLGLQRRGKTIVLTTHDVEFASLCGQRIVLMRRGGLIADGDARSILTDEATLRRASIIPPQVAQISLALSDIGFPKTHDIMEAKEAILEYLGGGD